MSPAGRPWPLQLLQDVSARCRELSPVRELWLRGSARSPRTLDRLSDLDLGLVLDGPLELARLLGDGDRVWALDRQSDGSRASCRVVLDDGRRLDLLVADASELARFGGERVYRAEPCRPGAGAGPLLLSVAPAADPTANEVRFLAASAVVKQARGDRLVSAHLALELAQRCLVEAMLLRDADTGTTAHRSGTRRDLEAGVVAAVLARRTVDPVSAVPELVEVFDRLHGELVPGYAPDWSGLAALLALVRTRAARLPP